MKERALAVFELRILTIWASNWGSKCSAKAQKALAGILARLDAQRPAEFPALTILQEIKELPADLKKAGIECGPVEAFDSTGRRIFPTDVN